MSTSRDFSIHIGISVEMTAVHYSVVTANCHVNIRLHLMYISYLTWNMAHNQGLESVYNIIFLFLLIQVLHNVNVCALMPDVFVCYEWSYLLVCVHEVPNKK